MVVRQKFGKLYPSSWGSLLSQQLTQNILLETYFPLLVALMRWSFYSILLYHSFRSVGHQNNAYEYKNILGCSGNGVLKAPLGHLLVWAPGLNSKQNLTCTFSTIFFNTCTQTEDNSRLLCTAKRVYRLHNNEWCMSSLEGQSHVILSAVCLGFHDILLTGVVLLKKLLKSSKVTVSYLRFIS